MEGESLVDRFVRGDADAVREVRAAIEGVVRASRPPAGALDDLVQEATGRVYLGLAAGRFRGMAALTTYAEGVARITCLEFRRRRQWSDVELQLLPSRDVWSEPERALLRDEEHRRNLRVFASLSPECRTLLHEVFVERRGYREVARELGISNTALRLRVHRCRSKIRSALRTAERVTTAVGRTKEGRDDA